MNPRYLAALAVGLFAGCGQGPAKPPTDPSATPTAPLAPAPQPPSAPLAPAAGGPAELPRAAPPAEVDRIGCSFFWRTSVTESFQPQNDRTVVMRRAGDGETFKLGDFDIRVGLRAPSQGGTSLAIEAAASPFVVADDYELGTVAATNHLPPGGHGFTGLRYVSNAQSKSQLQYFCGSFGPSDDVTKDTASQSRPGPSAPPEGFVQCSAAVVDRDGTVIDEQHFSLARARKQSEVPLRLGAFALNASYLPGEHESGGVTVDATFGAAGGLRDLYQTHQTDLPSNLLAHAGFTGVRSLTDPASGTTLKYQCAAVRD